MSYKHVGTLEDSTRFVGILAGLYCTSSCKDGSRITWYGKTSHKDRPGGPRRDWTGILEHYRPWTCSGMIGSGPSSKKGREIS